ncbi:hypothetical protein QNK12_18325 [Neobacillus cucumis]|nr:hypothetical protein QNK12_18325 [Neobacillus cucumis]
MSFRRLFDKKTEAKRQRINKEILRENGALSLHHNLKDNLQHIRQEVGQS